MPETEDTNASAFCVISVVALTTAESDRTVVLKRRGHIARDDNDGAPVKSGGNDVAVGGCLR
jgi:hypothetical protein